MSDSGLVVSLQPLQNEVDCHRGISSYSRSLALALAREGYLKAGLLDPNKGSPGNLPLELWEGGNLGWSSKQTWKRFAQSSRYLCYHISSIFDLSNSFQSLVWPLRFLPDMPVSATLYDLIPLELGEELLPTPRDKHIYQQRIQFLKASSAMLLAISDFTKQKALSLIEVPEDRLEVIGAGVEEIYFSKSFSQLSDHSRLLELDIGNRYIFAVLGNDSRKNFNCLLSAYASLPLEVRKDLPLVVAGCSFEHSAEWNRLITGVDLTKKDAIVLDRVDDQTMATLYRNALFAVYPSVLEGLGLPPLEAGACGCPTLLSKTLPLAKDLNCSDALFDPANARELSDLMYLGATNAGFLDNVLEHWQQLLSSYRWEKVAKRAIRAFEMQKSNLCRLSLKPLASPEQRMSIALVTPLPPSLTGVAQVSSLVIEHLSKLCDLHVFNPDCGVVPSSRVPGVRYSHLATLGRVFNPFSFDEIIYALGNSEHHVLSERFLQRYPGTVWLHDVILSGLYAVMSRKSEGLLRELLKEQRFGSTAHYTEEELFSFALGTSTTLTRRVLRAARSLILHSEHAREMLELDNPNEILPRTFIQPLPFPSPRVRGVNEAKERTIISCGIVHERKGTCRLIEMLELLRVRIPELKLAIIGGCVGSSERELREFISSKQLEGAVTLTGFIKELEYRSWIERGDLAIQLRTFSNGESSFAINECLASGVPVITNLPSCSAWPEGVVCQVEGFPSAEALAEIVEKMLQPNYSNAFREAGYRFARDNSARAFAEYLVRSVTGAQKADLANKVRVEPRRFSSTSI